MTQEQLDAYIQAAVILVTLGKASVAKVRAMFGHGAVLTEAELDAICAGVEDDATVRLALAQADLAAGGPDPNVP